MRALSVERKLSFSPISESNSNFRDLEIKKLPNIALSFRSDLSITIDKNRRLSRAVLRIFLNLDDRRWPEDGM